MLCTCFDAILWSHHKASPPTSSPSLSRKIQHLLYLCAYNVWVSWPKTTTGLPVWIHLNQCKVSIEAVPQSMLSNSSCAMPSPRQKGTHTDMLMMTNVTVSLLLNTSCTVPTSTMSLACVQPIYSATLHAPQFCIYMPLIRIHSPILTSFSRLRPPRRIYLKGQQK